MPEAIGDELYRIVPGPHDIQNRVRQLYVCKLPAATYIVDLAADTLAQDHIDRPAIILHVEPIPDVLSLAI